MKPYHEPEELPFRPPIDETPPIWPKVFLLTLWGILCFLFGYYVG